MKTRRGNPRPYRSRWDRLKLAETYRGASAERRRPHLLVPLPSLRVPPSGMLTLLGYATANLYWPGGRVTFAVPFAENAVSAVWYVVPSGPRRCKVTVPKVDPITSTA